MRFAFMLLLAMDGGQIAVFAVQDMLLFFLAWELELIPVYLLLAKDRHAEAADKQGGDVFES